MSETDTEATENLEPTEDTGSEMEPDWKSEAEKWKSLSRKNEDAAKSNATKAKEYDAYVESQKTEQERAADAVKTLSGEKAGLASENAKLKAALKYGLSDEDLELLGDGSPEQIETRAEKLATRIGSQKPAGPSTSAIARTNATQKTDDYDTAIADARAARNFPLAITLQQRKSAELAERKD